MSFVRVMSLDRPLGRLLRSREAEMLSVYSDFRDSEGQSRWQARAGERAYGIQRWILQSLGQGGWANLLSAPPSVQRTRFNEDAGIHSGQHCSIEKSICLFTAWSKGPVSHKHGLVMAGYRLRLYTCIVGLTFGFMCGFGG